MLKYVITIMAFFMIPIVAHATLVMDSVQFDPAIISAGDTVDVVIQFHDQVSTTTNSRAGDPTYEYKVTLVNDDTISQQYTLIENALGDDVYGRVYAGGYYNKRFRVKVNNNAPPGTYGFKIIGKWYHNGIAESGTQELKFSMPVKKEGISLTLSNIVSNPQKIRSGDKNVLLSAELFNSGEKLAKNVVVKFEYPKDISASYTNDNQILTGVVNSMEGKNMQFYIDTEKTIPSGVYYLNYTLSYEDVDSNKYTKTSTIPIVIKKKPNVEVESAKAIGKAGDDITFNVVLKNIGEEKAESVDVRLITQASQPFDMDMRSAYVGQMQPGQEATATFTIHASSEAEIKTHNINLAIRAKGDSEEGDSDVYTYTGNALIDITGKSTNNYPFYGLVFLVIIIVGSAVFYAVKPKKKK